MRKLISMGLLACSLCIASLCQAAESDIATLPLLDESRPVVTAAADVQQQVQQEAKPEPVKAVRPPLQVMISATAPNEEQAVVLAKKKAVSKAIQYLQEQDYAHEYKAEVFSLAKDYDKYIIAYNVRIEKTEANSLTLAVRVDLNRELLQESVECYQLMSTPDKADSTASSPQNDTSNDMATLA